MAHPSTARRRFGAALTALGIGVAAAVTLVGMAGTASAHVPEIKAECTENGTVLRVNLKNYDASGENTVKITDGEEVLLDTTVFESNFDQTFEGLDATVDHVFTADVKAHDDPDGSQGFTKVLTAEAASCVTPPPTSSEPPPTSSEAPPAPTTSAPAPQPAPEPPLAETGASIALPLGIGALLLVGGGVLLFVVRRRSRA
jgi:LPXTG-motif cell wall-anchored protein